MFRDIVEIMRLRRDAPASQFRRAVKTHYDVTELDYPIRQFKNGTIATSILYYLTARDQRNGKLNPFWARGQLFLAHQKEEDGQSHFTNPEYRYHTATLEADATKQDIRTAISDHHKQFRRFARNHMAMHGGDFSDTYGRIRPAEEWSEEGNGVHNYRYKFIGYTNEDFALGVHENEAKHGGGWTLKIYAPYEKIVKGSGFVELDGIQKHQKLLNTIVSSGYEYGTYETREEALANMYMVMNDRLQLTWQGQSPIKMHEATFTNVTTKAYNFFVKEFKKPENAKEAETEVIAAVLAAAFTRIAFTVSFAWGLTYGIGIKFAGKKAMDLYDITKKEAAWWWKKAASVHPKRAEYIDATRENMRRIVNTKPNLEMDVHLDVLDGNRRNKGVDVTHDPDPQISPKQRNWKALWLSAYSGKAFSQKNNYIDRNTSTNFSFNGLVRLVRRDPDTGNLITYSQYVEALDVNDKISIPEDIKKLLQESRVIKTVQRENIKTVSIEDISFEEMEEEVIPSLFRDYPKIDNYMVEAAADHIKWLFGEKTCPKQELIPARPPPNKSTIARIFGDPNAEIHYPSPELVAFFRGCVLPYASCTLKP